MNAPPAGQLAGSWGGDPGVLALVLVACAWYVAGARRRPARVRAHASTRAHDVAFAAGVLTIVTALASPLDTAAEYVQWAHMAQHVLLSQVAAPLFVLAVPLATFRRVLPLSWRRRVVAFGRAPATRGVTRVVLHPAFAFATFSAAWWAWHIPALYDAALRHAPVHAAEHVSLFATGLLWWACVVGAHRAGTAQRLALTVATGLHLNVLGALLTLSPRLLYTGYHGAYGLGALEDQQLAGVLMWVLGGFVSIALVLAIVHEVLRDSERDAPALVAPLAPLP